jgi:NCAIR mutase (PurE)-related protein
MERGRLRALLEAVRDGKREVDDALAALRDYPYEALGFAAVDHHRDLRQGVPEAVLCDGKTPAAAAAIVKRLAVSGAPVIATRADGSTARMIRKAVPEAEYHARARVVLANPRPPADANGVVVVTAGTADLPVAEEAALTAGALGSGVSVVCDVGVAGAHRLVDQLERLRAARVVIVVAGMDGALPSLVGGLIPQPVIAVPTSCGYGAHFGGIAPLLAMLTSCAAGVAVVNIDNGFGAGVLAHRIERLGRERPPDAGRALGGRLRSRRMGTDDE